ncbi:Short-chain dehydrogenase/reductase aba4 [Conoideocrella luteorostrata]|uniref:Short-chain dehydrogenase/reductase aba4 n=1 Tax=Conoideocrella luteorostrata TaxID=1105319 RepID=A0AAJ0G141_9HYPO|nr:Short-chain dehydrogenase/reductase aba4 [Conoideocrella luteorostrata]
MTDIKASVHSTPELEQLDVKIRQFSQDQAPSVGGVSSTLSTKMTQTNGVSYWPLKGKVYAITGGASGIGLATAQSLSRKGATVCIADVDPEAMKSAEKYFGGLGAPYMITKVDVAKRTQVDNWIASIVEKYGRLDGAANVAGVIGKAHGIASVAELEDEEWDKIIGVNLTGTMYCLRAQLRHIVDGGSIVNVSSIHGVKGFAKHAAYDASKHGIIGLTKAAALENGDREIRVNSVAPGAIYTPLMQKNWDASGRPKDAAFDDPSAFKRQGTSEETANVIVFLLGPESTFVSGSVYQVDGAWI